MRRHLLLILLIVGALSSGTHAQYRWHVVLPDPIDTLFYRGFSSISCSGENCIATEIIYANLSHQDRLLGDSNVILCSHDGGMSWSPVAAGIPRWKYDSLGKSRVGLYFDASQQIDSLDAIVADKQYGVTIITHDGWKTWRVDSSNKDGIHSVNFANVAEGRCKSHLAFIGLPLILAITGGARYLRMVSPVVRMGIVPFDCLVCPTRFLLPIIIGVRGIRRVSQLVAC